MLVQVVLVAVADWSTYNNVSRQLKKKIRERASLLALYFCANAGRNVGAFWGPEFQNMQ